MRFKFCARVEQLDLVMLVQVFEETFLLAGVDVYEMGGEEGGEQEQQSQPGGE